VAKALPPESGKQTDPLAALLQQVDKAVGVGALYEFGSREPEPVDVISTGSIGLDEALGVGGFPRGRIIELYGPESSGKTTVALTCAAQAQQKGLRVAMVDAEHALDPDWAATLGVDVGKLLLSQPDNGEQGLEIAAMTAASGAVGLIIVDSVAALVPRAEIEGEMGDSHVGLHARLMSQALRKLTAITAGSKTTIIFINQLREKIGVMFGSPETTTGGKALKFYSTCRLDVRRIETLKDGTDAVGNRVKVKVVKNKVAPPFKVAEFDLLFGYGISRAGELIDLGVQRGIVKKAGAWYTYEGDQLGQGKEKARLALMAEPELFEKIEKQVRDAKPVVAAPAPRGAALTMSDPFGVGRGPASD
jgi:recombination protein RecA